MSLIRVTEVLSKYQDWSKVSPDKLNAGSERGTALHKSFAAYAKGLWLPYADDLHGYFQSFQKWFDSMVIRVIFVELRLNDETYGFTGQIDLGAILKGDQCGSIIDWKSSITKQNIWEGQAAAYLALATRKFPQHNFERCMSIRVKSDGNVPLIAEYKNNLNAFRAFLGALNAHKYFIG